MSMNKLTERLLAEGYTKDNHPDYVRWYGARGEFEYTSKYLATTVWEAPCGIMRKGDFTHGYLSYAGVDWRVENDNYNFHCPYRKKDCKFFDPLLKDLIIGAKCSWHMANKPYDYNNSAEKIIDERRATTLANLEKKFGHPSMIHCACCHISEETLEPYFRFEPNDCIRFMNNGCDNKKCWCTGKQRDLTRANVYYDVKVTTEYKKGFIVEPVIKITKGIKLFEAQKAITDLELYLKLYPDAPMQKEKRKTKHLSKLFFAEYHGQKYDLEVLNIRIEKKESRDLTQDLQDINEGIEVVHASDLKKASAQAKKERREEYKKAKAKRKEAAITKKLISTLSDDTQSEEMRQWAKQKLKRRGIETEPKYKQIGMF